VGGRQIEHKALLIFVHNFYLKPEYLASGRLEEDPNVVIESATLTS